MDGHLRKPKKWAPGGSLAVQPLSPHSTPKEQEVSITSATVVCLFVESRWTRTKGLLVQLKRTIGADVSMGGCFACGFIDSSATSTCKFSDTG